MLKTRSKVRSLLDPICLTFYNFSNAHQVSLSIPSAVRLEEQPAPEYAGLPVGLPANKEKKMTFFPGRMRSALFFSAFAVVSFLLTGSTAVPALSEPAVDQCFAMYNGAIIVSSVDGSALQEALDQNTYGNVLVSGTCTGTFTVTKDVGILGGYSPDFTIHDPAAYPTVLDAELAGTVLTITSPGFVTLDDLNIVNGDNPGNGGGVYNATALYVYDTVFSSNYADRGGGLYNAAYIEIYDSTFSSNIASEAGAGIYNDGYLEMQNSTFNTNQVPTGYGGGLYISPTAGPFIAVSGTSFTGNLGDDGGAIYNASPNNPNIFDTTLANNSAANGGGIFNSGSGTLFWNGGSIRGNTASSNGGGIYNEGALVQLTLADLESNQADTGGGIASFSGDVEIYESRLAGNQASSLGGGVFNIDPGVLYIEESELIGNSASSGGGIANDTASLTLSQSTLAWNTASSAGGALSNAEGDVSIENSTLSGNVAVSDSAIHNSLGNLWMSFSTVSDSSGGGIVNIGDGAGAGTLTLWSTIVANSNAPWGDCTNSNGVAGGTYNLIESTGAQACGLSAGSNILGQDPKLGPLTGNGGATATHALLNSSPALDNGETNICPSIDQRGVSRPQTGPDGPACDIGAYERAPSDMPYRLYLPIAQKGN